MTNTQTLQRKGGNSIRKVPDIYKLLQIAVLSKKTSCFKSFFEAESNISLQYSVILELFDSSGARW
jgi:hypothetical protein